MNVIKKWNPDKIDQRCSKILIQASRKAARKPMERPVHDQDADSSKKHEWRFGLS